MLFSTIEAGTEIQTQPTNQGRVVTILLEKRGIKKKKKTGRPLPWQRLRRSRRRRSLWEARALRPRGLPAASLPGSLSRPDQTTRLPVAAGDRAASKLVWAAGPAGPRPPRLGLAIKS